MKSLKFRNIQVNADFQEENEYSYILIAIIRENAAIICYEADESHANFRLSATEKIFTT